MKNNILFSKDIIKCCEVCSKGKPSFDNSAVFCIKNGVMAPNDYCKSFKYDLLKRKPKKPGIFSDYKAEDFEI